MSDEDRDVDIESDDDGDESGGSGGRQPTQEEKRAHHNALERKRRDHIKDSFSSLRDSVPDLQGEKQDSKVSRAQILKRAAEYITSMKEKNTTNVKDIESMKRANKQLEQEIAFLENYPESGDQVPGFNEENVRSDLSDEEDQNRSRRKRQKVATANS